MSTLTEEQRKLIEKKQEDALLKSRSSNSESDNSEDKNTLSDPSSNKDAKRIKLLDEPTFSSNQHTQSNSPSKSKPPGASSLIDEESIEWLDKPKFPSKQNSKSDSSSPENQPPLPNSDGETGEDESDSEEEHIDGESEEESSSDDAETYRYRDREVWVLNKCGPRRLKMIDGRLKDDGPTEATFQFVVPNISRLKETTYSPPCIIRDLPWKIMVTLKTIPSKDGQLKKYLGFLLQCNGLSEFASWKYHVVADFKLLSVKENQKPFTRRFQHVLHSKGNTSGYPRFMVWDDVLDPDKGYIKDDSITLEVKMKTFRFQSEVDKFRKEEEKLLCKDCRSDATFQFEVPNVSRLKETMYSSPRIVRDFSWKIGATQDTIKCYNGQLKTRFGFLLKCNSVNDLAYWKCPVVADLKLLSVKENQEPFTLRSQQVLNSKDNDCGYPWFMAWNDVLDPDKGYIKDDSITLEVVMKTFKCLSEFYNFSSEERAQLSKGIANPAKTD